MSLDGAMVHNSWAESDASAVSQNQHNPPANMSSASAAEESLGADDQFDRQLLRALMQKYTPEGLSRLMQEERTSALSNPETASIITNSTYSSVRSDDAPSIFDSGSSIRTLSDTSSARGSIISNVSARTAKFLSRKTHPGRDSSATGVASSSSSSINGVPTHEPLNESTETLPPSSASQCDDEGTPVDSTSGLSINASKQKGAFVCGFCKEEGIPKTCTRKNDLKRHIEDFHSMNALWFCSQQGCGMVFDWPTVYKNHLKRAHGGSRMVPDDAKVVLCPQTVFACGFDNCIQVFESPSDDDAGATFKDYVAHVVKHLDEGSNSGEWTYTTRMRNLMRQSGVLNAWAASYPQADRDSLNWQPQTSGVLRKCLETRHLGDLHLLIQYAAALGSGNPSAIPDLGDRFAIPVRDDCQAQIPGHQNRRPIQIPPPPPPPQAPMPQHMRHQPAPPPPPPPQQQAPEADQFSFKISRGGNPHLAHYYASQRRVFPTKPPVRAGRSARPPMHTLAGGSMPPPPPHHHQGFQQPAQQMFDPTGMWPPQHQQHHPNMHYAHQQMVTPADAGGIIAEDLRSLRPLANSATQGSTDVDMSDAQMMDSSAYMTPHQDYTTASYPNGGLQSPAPSDDCIKMEQPDHFGAYDTHNGY